MGSSSDFIPLLARTSSDLDASGVDRRQQSRLVERGTLHRVRHGVYVPADRWREISARQRFVEFARAAALNRPTPLVFSHVTAAILLGLPLVGPLPRRLDVLTVGASGRRSERDIVAHRSSDSCETTQVAGLNVTDLERTLVDVSATEPLGRSLPMIDHALHDSRTEKGRLQRHLAARSSLRARARAARALDLGDGRADNAGESFSRATIIDGGFARPELQRRFALPGGRTAIVDFYWPSSDLIGEFDGRLKYGRADGTPDADALWAEKKREDALRNDGHRLIRWTWDDAWAGDPLLRRLANAAAPRA
ncbi:hypothetical protein GCM10025867_17840 [Frondihabitans sucicola]|uniref:AbiEi antitoxin N-terminal domain-containing protein n=1 Tax=Frondihabitans sucicola TaxID=1268041 RepID=A0ABN6XX33_9MICO|nr:type IV toxin-antitoxin system AbiEi family antitoxin domain-containing protein [Frondihabitans sucicola]BDZ49543.1 hypothetical protein GCM10025867_17840 [Frondihabitans sucicola]